MEGLLGGNQTKLQGSYFSLQSRVRGSVISYYVLDVSLFFSFFCRCWLTMARMYTREMSAITSLVEDARRRYLETSRPNVVVHTADQVGFTSSQSPLSRTNSCNKHSSPTLAHLSTGLAPRIKLVDLSVPSFYRTVSLTPLFVTHVNFWILQTGMSKPAFRIVGGISFMDLLERAKVCFLAFGFAPHTEFNVLCVRFDYLCSR